MLTFNNPENHGKAALLGRLKSNTINFRPADLNAFLELTFSSENAEKDFFKSLSERFSSQEIHHLNEQLAKHSLDDSNINQEAISSILAEKRNFALSLAMELWRNNEICANHLKESGVFHAAISFSLAEQTLTSIAHNAFSFLSNIALRRDPLLETFKPMVQLLAPYVLDRDLSPESSAQEFRTDRPASSILTGKTMAMLNSIDAFIIKYFVAGLDEARKNENWVETVSARRGRCKVLVALDIRTAILEGKTTTAAMKDIFFESLSKHGFHNNYSNFMSGASTTYITGDLKALLESCLQQMPRP